MKTSLAELGGMRREQQYKLCEWAKRHYSRDGIILIVMIATRFVAPYFFSKPTVDSWQRKKVG